MAKQRSYYSYTVEKFDSETWIELVTFNKFSSGVNLESAKSFKHGEESECPTPGICCKYRIVKQLVQVGEPEVVPEAETVI